jgi:hypothetical protein
MFETFWGVHQKTYGTQFTALLIFSLLLSGSLWITLALTFY